jgi:RNA polymerase sigma factor (sigma-70 family)
VAGDVRLRACRCAAGQGWHLTSKRPAGGAGPSGGHRVTASQRHEAGQWQETGMPPGNGAPAPTVGAKLDIAHPAEIGAFYEKEMPRLVLFVTISTGLDIHAAADVAQTAFERALPRWAGLRHPRAWLYRVAHNEAIARCEAVRREVPVDVVPDRADHLSAALAAEWRAEQREVMSHLQNLAPQQRQVMTWTLAGFSDSEIAGALDLTTQAVKQSRYYARRNLAKRLGTRERDTR